MPPKLLSDDGRHIVIRPLAYVANAISPATRARASFADPCTLCGSQPNLERAKVGRMLRAWSARTRVASSRFSRRCAMSRHHSSPIQRSSTSPVWTRAVTRVACRRRPGRSGEHGSRGRQATPGSSGSIRQAARRTLSGRADPPTTVRRIERLLMLGVNWFLDLTWPGELPEYETQPAKPVRSGAAGRSRTRAGRS